MNIHAVSSSRWHRLAVLIFAGVGTLCVSAIAFAAIVSGTTTTGISAHVTITQLVINKPNTVAGDFMLASIAVNGGNSVNITAPSEWTQIGRTDNDVNVSLISYWKIAGASEPSNYTWTIDQQTRAVGGITRYSGVEAFNPIDSVAGNTGFGLQATTSVITASGGNEEIVALFATDVNKALSVPAGMTENFQLSNAPLGPTMAADQMIQVASGSAGSKTSVISGNKSRNWATQQIALKVAPTATIAFDASSSNIFIGNTALSLVTSHTVSGANRILFSSITVAASGNNADLITTVTYSGVPMTLAGKVATHSANTNGLETYLYYLTNPDLGTHDIVANLLPGSLGIWEANSSYTGASQSGVLDASSVSATELFLPSISGTVTTVANNDWVVMGSYSGDGNTSAGVGTTIRATSPSLDRQVLSDNGGPKSPPGSVTLTVNNNSDRVGSVTAAISPAN